MTCSRFGLLYLQSLVPRIILILRALFGSELCSLTASKLKSLLETAVTGAWLSVEKNTYRAAGLAEAMVVAVEAC
jgi:hypothetical protein